MTADQRALASMMRAREELERRRRWYATHERTPERCSVHGAARYDCNDSCFESEGEDENE